MCMPARTTNIAYIVGINYAQLLTGQNSMMAARTKNPAISSGGIILNV
jgi:hypothetical protein